MTAPASVEWQAKDIPDTIVVLAYGQRKRAALVGRIVGAEPPTFPHEEIAKVTGAPVKVAYAACERAHKRGLIDYGVSLRAGFLTDKGKALLGSVIGAR